MLTQEQWDIERAKLVQAQADIQSVIEGIDAAFSGTPSGVVWDRTGVANNPTFSNGDLTVAATAAHALRSTVSVPLSKRYFEVAVDCRGTAGHFAVGVIRSDQPISSPPTSLAAVPSGMWLWRDDTWWAHGGASGQIGSAWATGDTIMVAFDDTGNLWFGRNGTWMGDPVNGTGPAFTGLTGDIGACFVFMGSNGSPVATGRFSVSCPTGFATLDA
jgi:hypothetical protein